MPSLDPGPSRSPCRRNHSVVVGEFDQRSDEGVVQILKIRQVFNHPNYTKAPYSKDMALVKLVTPARFSDTVSPICVPSANDYIPEDSRCITSGWGRTSYDDYTGPKKLQQAALPLLSNTQCEKFWSSHISPEVVCARTKGASSCRGDSGGPLVCQKAEAWTLTGIVSWGSQACARLKLVVYTCN
ncbi:chymotrypsinogen 2-like [Dromiciops gliroides]|uniref:chymotrypsinogen 2-like n=1 Tax=Dromiciops gliroides TaxID=33562 RepID=UPI001CC3A8DE|nr:chymotrypsinogen 2-like [Dromiciops gliroides]